MTLSRADLNRWGRGLLAAVLLFVTAGEAAAQFSVRPEDPTGLSIREKRVRVIHSTDASVPGTSMHLQQWDPWLAYQRGRSYYFREWGTEDGVFTHLPNRPEAAAATSCGVCHNTPFPSVGAGGNVGISVRVGRNAVHFFGAGLLETLAIQLRAQLINKYDLNGNGYIDVPEESLGKRAYIESSAGHVLDFGSLHDDNGDGRPDLNPVIMFRAVGEDGKARLFNSRGRPASMRDEETVGYDIALGVFASSAGDHQFPSVRMFSTGVFVTIMGILPEVDSSEVQPLGMTGGFLTNDWGRFSNTGAFLSEVLLTGDPYAEKDLSKRPTISEGELDLLDWFMINHPAPALGPQTAQTLKGRELMTEFGCTSCHVQDWEILPADPEKNLPGDRRFFDLETEYNYVANQMQGTLHDLTVPTPGPNGQTLNLPKRDGFVVKDIFTDLRHHNLGPRWREYHVSGEHIRLEAAMFRTSPLWGVGSTPPYGHDGRSPTLDHVIRRHEGDAIESSTAYKNASQEDRDALLAFLRSLVLYQPESLPTDMNGDGRITTAHKINGHDVGPEIFRPEFMLRKTPIYEGWTESPDGDRYFSYALQNVGESYGEYLEALVDRDKDTVPDIIDPDAPRPPVQAKTENEEDVGELLADAGGEE
ncbi:MAG: di-heme oxidoredictase family protein [Acidobacteriota bacterium]